MAAASGAKKLRSKIECEGHTIMKNVTVACG